MYIGWDDVEKQFNTQQNSAGMYLMSELAPSHGKYPAGATLRVRPPLKHRLKKLAMFDATRKTVISKTLGNWICFTEVTNIINVFQHYQGHTLW